LGIVPVSSETEDKFEDPMEVTASSRLVEIARVEIRSTTHLSIGVEGSNTDNSCFIGQIFNASSPGGSGVFIDANDRLGTITSSERFKDDIQQMEAASETLFVLNRLHSITKRRLIQQVNRSLDL